MLTEHCNGMLPYGPSHPVPVVCPSPLHFHNGYSPSPWPCKSFHPQYHTSLLSFYDIVIPLREHVPHKNILSNFLASIQQQLNKYIHFRVFLGLFFFICLFCFKNSEILPFHQHIFIDIQVEIDHCSITYKYEW